jgi:uncharacterized tellurite resistance protein B-like protein
MGVLEWLGLGGAARGGGELRTEVVERIGAVMSALPDDRARVLAAFAYLLGRVAHADHALTPEETAAMEGLLVEMGNLTGPQAAAVVAIAQEQSLRHRGTEDFRVAQEFAAIATEDDKRALLRCLFAVSASDEAVVVAEDNEIRRITQELKVTHEEFVQAKLAVRDRLAVLRRVE